jgi:hypothetical protein
MCRPQSHSAAVRIRIDVFFRNNSINIASSQTWMYLHSTVSSLFLFQVSAHVLMFADIVMLVRKCNPRRKCHMQGAANISSRSGNWIQNYIFFGV